MDQVHPSFRRALRPLSRRLMAGLFLDIWPPWAIGSLLAAGVMALVCRLFVPAAAPYLQWLWLAPLVGSLPALLLCWRRRYLAPDVVAIADWLGGGQGMLLALHERDGSGWATSPHVASSLSARLPRLRPQRLAVIVPATAFLAIALWLPQRLPVQAASLLASDVTAELEAAIEELKAEQLITAEEEQKLEEEIERIRQAAEERIDAGAWEAADALRERMVAAAAEKQDAASWAETTLSQYAAAVSAAGSMDAPSASSAAGEFNLALQKLAAAGLLEDASDELKALLRGGKLPTDPASLQQLQQSLAMCLGTKGGRGRSGQAAFGRFDPAEFPLDNTSESSSPGQGGATRGRADAPLTRGDETRPYDRFKAQPLPPGAARSPDDWTPVTTIAGVPDAAPESGSRSRARQYEETAGQAAWRRTLAPRHQSAVKKYFSR